MLLVPVLNERDVLSSSSPSRSSIVRVGSPPESDGVGGVVVADVSIGEEGSTSLGKEEVVVVLAGSTEDRVLVREEREVGSLGGSGGDGLVNEGKVHELPDLGRGR